MSRDRFRWTAQESLSAKAICGPRQQTFENLKAALEANGAKFENVVKLNYYVLDVSQLSAVREVRDKFVNTANRPASTAVEVKRLFREGFLIEVEAVASVPE